MEDIQRDRSIRNIPVSPTHRDFSASAPHRYSPPLPRSPQEPPPQKIRRKSRMVWVAAVVVVGCGILGLLISTVFEVATITITPKMVEVPTPQTLVAQPQGSGVFTYQTITATQAATTTVVANGTQRVSKAAVGTVIIYNTYDSTVQKLIANTRLATADGKIYRIKEAVAVPGVTKKVDGTLVPGSVSVSVVADKPGAEYNQLSPVPFTIPGFKGDPRFSKFTGQSKGEIQGGLVGVEPAVSPSDMAQAQNELRRQLDSRIRSTATSQVPEGFTAVNGSLGVTYTDITQQPGKDKTVVLSQGATATLAMVRVAELAQTLARRLDQDYKNEDIAFGDFSKVQIAITGSISGGPLSLIIEGTPTLVWHVDTEMIKQELASKKKSQFKEIVANFEPSVAVAQASIRPFWKATFPVDTHKVHIIVSPEGK